MGACWADTLLAALLCISKIVAPGPLMLLVLQGTMKHGLRAGLCVAVGIAAADAAYAGVVLFGTTGVLSLQSVEARVLQAAGAGVLLVLGLDMIADGIRRGGTPAGAAAMGQERPAPGRVSAHRLPPMLRALTRGFLGGVGNVSTPVFLISMQAIVLRPASGPALAAAGFIAISVATRGALALLFSRPWIRVHYRRRERWLNVTGGGVMLAMAGGSVWRVLG